MLKFRVCLRLGSSDSHFSFLRSATSVSNLAFSLEAACLVISFYCCCCVYWFRNFHADNLKFSNLIRRLTFPCYRSTPLNIWPLPTYFSQLSYKLFIRELPGLCVNVWEPEMTMIQYMHQNWSGTTSKGLNTPCMTMKTRSLDSWIVSWELVAWIAFWELLANRTIDKLRESSSGSVFICSSFSLPEITLFCCNSFLDRINKIQLKSPSAWTFPESFSF